MPNRTQTLWSEIVVHACVQVMFKNDMSLIPPPTTLLPIVPIVWLSPSAHNPTLWRIKRTKMYSRLWCGYLTFTDYYTPYNKIGKFDNEAQRRAAILAYLMIYYYTTHSHHLHIRQLLHYTPKYLRNLAVLSSCTRPSSLTFFSRSQISGDSTFSTYWQVAGSSRYSCT